MDILHRDTGVVLASVAEDLGDVLRDANPHHADLRGVRLVGADLRGADLRGAQLGDADMRDTDLRGATLRGAEMHRICLRDADLRGADVSCTDLSFADLRGADLRGACVYSVRLTGADLRGALGVIDCGQRSDGYRFVLVLADDDVFVSAGCRYFSVASAEQHWGNGTPLGDESLALIRTGLLSTRTHASRDYALVAARHVADALLRAAELAQIAVSESTARYAAAREVADAAAATVAAMEATTDGGPHSR